MISNIAIDTNKKENRFILKKSEKVNDTDDAVYLGLLRYRSAQVKSLLHSLELAARGTGLYKNSDKTDFMCFNQYVAILPSRLWLQNTPTASPTNECPGYDSKQSDSEAPVMLELWGRWSTPLFPSLPGPLWPRMVVIY